MRFVPFMPFGYSTSYEYDFGSYNFFLNLIAVTQSAGTMNIK